jgi:tetratricopeptide (TPR) repeat protein
MQEINQAQIELVQTLLDSHPEESGRILAAKPELINAELVTVMISAAISIEKEYGDRAESTVLWLRNLAGNLAIQLNLNFGRDQQQLAFLLESLRLTIESDSSVVYDYLQQDLGLIDDELIELLKLWTNRKLQAVDHEEKLILVRGIGTFGSLMKKFLLGNNAVNIDMSITCYEIIADVFRVMEDWRLLATTYNNLGNAYLARIRGDRAENLEASISHYAAALEVQTKDQDAVEWAATQNNLANAYSQRILGEKGENIEQAINMHTSVLEIYTQHNYPDYWLMTQNNLAQLYQERILGDKSENLEKSIRYCNTALSIVSKMESPDLWAITQINLANAYSDLTNGENSQNLDKAIGYYNAALEIYTKDYRSIDWARTQRTIGYLYEKVGKHQQAIECYLKSLEVFQPETHATEAMLSSWTLSNLYIEKEQWPEAMEICEIGLKAADIYLEWSSDVGDRQQAHQDGVKIYKNAIRCAIKLERYQVVINLGAKAQSTEVWDLISDANNYQGEELPAEMQEFIKTKFKKG